MMGPRLFYRIYKRKQDAHDVAKLSRLIFFTSIIITTFYIWIKNVKNEQRKRLKERGWARQIRFEYLILIIFNRFKAREVML